MKRFVAAVVFTTVLFSSAYGQKIVSQIAVKVNKDIILVSEVEKAKADLRTELSQDPKLKGAQLEQSYDEKSKDVVRDLIDKQLILQQASDLGMNADLEVLKQVEQLRVDNHFATTEALEAEMLKQGIAIDDVKDSIRFKNLRSQVFRKEVTGKIVITNEESRAYYEAHKSDFDRPPGVSIGMIAVATEGMSEAEVQAQRKKMEDALASLKKGDDFSELAHKVSEDASAPDGGDLGFFEKQADGTYGLASPEMEVIVAKLNKGQNTDILTNPTNHTLVIVKLLDRHDGGILPFEIASNEIYGTLMDDRAQPKIRDYLTKLRAEGYVEVYPGYVDSGAATKPVRASETAIPR